MISYAQWGNELYYGRRSYNIVGNRKIFIGIGLTLVAICLVLAVFPGINPGIEFTGGTEFTISSPKEHSQQLAQEVLNKYDRGADARVTNLGTSDIRVQTDAMESADAQEAAHALAQAYGVADTDVAHNLVGPVWGQQITTKAAISLVVFLVLVGFVMTLYFWTWTMSFSAIFALLHDVTLTVGVFAITQVEVTPATIIGLLTILGYSLYDTVVVFDKVRELTADLTMQRKRTYAELVNLAVNQTMVRSINTSITAILPVGAILFVGSYLLGAGTLRDISLALFVGMIVGTLSSIFIASPMLVALRSREQVIKEHTKRVERRREKEAAQGDSQEASDQSEGSEGSDTGMVEAAGFHKGQAAQPKRLPRSKR